MRNKKQKEIPTRLERFELKYLIPIDLIDPISEFCAIYCSEDMYSQKSADGFYDIFSLYFDSPNHTFLRYRLEKVENRFNMRIRSYDPHSGLPCFFEIKQKRSQIVRKYRAPVRDPEWSRMLQTSAHPLKRGENENERLNKELFIRLSYAYQAAPKVLTHYRRKAFISDVNDYARVTFDVNLRYQAEERYNLIPDENRMFADDDESAFDPGCNVILELKCYQTQVPLWMMDLIRYFNLKRGSFSKYALSMKQVLGEFNYAPGDRVSPLSSRQPSRPTVHPPWEEDVPCGAHGGMHYVG